MRLFWKLFFILLLTLLLTAALSSWMSQAWLEENQAVETRLDELAGLGETAASLFELDNRDHYRRWLHQTMRTRHFHGTLIHDNGVNGIPRPLAADLQPLATQIIREKQSIRLIHPHMLAIAIPVRTATASYYWLASSPLPPEFQRDNGRQCS